MIKLLIQELKKPENDKAITMGYGGKHRLTINFNEFDIEKLERACLCMEMLDNPVFVDRFNIAMLEFAEYVKAMKKPE